MSNWWDDVKNAMKATGGAIGTAETYVNPFDPQSGKTAHALSEAAKLGTDKGSGGSSDSGGTSNNSVPANADVSSWDPFAVTTQSGQKGDAAPGNPNNATTAKMAPAATGPTNTQQPANVNDVLNMGLGMFMNQYMAPYMQALSQQNNQTISNWGNVMGQMNTQALPPNVRQLINATYPMQGQLLSMMNQSQANQVANVAPFNQFLTQLGGETSGIQALQQAFAHAATASDLNLGNQTALGTALQQVLQQYGGANSQGSILAALLAGAGSSTGVPGLPPAIAQAAQPTTGTSVSGG